MIDSNTFVSILKKVVRDQSVKDVLNGLNSPPGKKPSPEQVKMSNFYKGLPEADKEIFLSILNSLSDNILFGIFCVLDGVRAIENGPDKGSLELYYKKGQTSILINNLDEDFLHDLM